MKQAIVSQAARTTTGTQDWTDAGFSSDAKLLLLFGTNATASNTATADGSLGIGATNKTGMAACHTYRQDAVATTLARSYNSSAMAFMFGSEDSSSSDIDVDLTGVSHPATGIQVNYSDVSNDADAIMIGGLLLGGSDIEASVVYGDVSTTSPVSVSHGLSGAPDCFIVIGNTDGNASGAGGSYNSIGFSDGTNQCCQSSFANTAVALASAGWSQYVSNAAVGAKNNNGSIHHTITLSNIGATTFDLTADVAPAATERWHVICIKGVSDAKAGVFQVPASSGNSAVVTGMSAAPTVLLMAPTVTNNLNSAVTDDEAGWVGFGMAVNNGGSTQQVSGGMSSDIGGSGGVTVEKSYIHTSKALVTRDIDAGEEVTATVQSWDSGGVTLNFSAVGDRQAYVPYLAFGSGASTTKYLKLSTAPGTGAAEKIYMTWAPAE